MDADAFFDLKILKELVLSGNNIEVISSNTFRGLVSLEKSFQIFKSKNTIFL
jgi:hypothetical protein